MSTDFIDIQTSTTMVSDANTDVDVKPKKSKRELAIKRAFDNILLTSRGTASSPTESEEALSNTRWFLIEDNNNFDLSQDEIRTSDDLDGPEAFMDPSNPPEKGWNSDYVRWRTLRFVQALPFRLLTLTLILVDLVLICVDIAINCPSAKGSRTVGFLDMTISCYFILEIAMRIYALTPKVFFSKKSWFNMIDFTVVILTFLISVIYTSVVEKLYADGAFLDDEGVMTCTPEDRGSGAAHFLKLAKFLVVLRFLRFVRLVRLVRLYTEHHQIKRAIRQTVSQNKRRYQKDGVDLDLTYVTEHLIAMSFPSSGFMAWYRNHIKDVSYFLDKHHKDSYKVYNLCSERTYPDSWFHERVSHWPVDDHNVPSVREMVDFVIEAQSWMASGTDRVIAVHCKGGKGRTGTMVCILLIEMELFRDAAKSLEFFGQRRTDNNVSEKFQGVETASQIRYVTYYEMLKNRFPGEMYPPDVDMRLEEITIFGLHTVGRGDGSDLSFDVALGRNPLIFSASVGDESAPMTSEYSASEDALRIALAPKTHVEVTGDVRIKFNCASYNVPKGYEKCAFYFWFHTAFLDVEDASVDEHSFVLRLSREELDNPHKQKTWKTFGEEFAVRLRLRRVRVKGKLI